MSYSNTSNSQMRTVGDAVTGVLSSPQEAVSAKGNKYAFALVTPADGGGPIRLFGSDLVLLDTFGASTGSKVTLIVTGYRNGFPEFRIFDVEGTDQEE
jgi:hypothetical protein